MNPSPTSANLARHAYFGAEQEAFRHVDVVLGFRVWGVGFRVEG